MYVISKFFLCLSRVAGRECTGGVRGGGARPYSGGKSCLYPVFSTLTALIINDTWKLLSRSNGAQSRRDQPSAGKPCSNCLTN